jgi:hypothetical protein
VPGLRRPAAHRDRIYFHDHDFMGCMRSTSRIPRPVISILRVFLGDMTAA